MTFPQMAPTGAGAKALSPTRREEVAAQRGVVVAVTTLGSFIAPRKGAEPVQVSWC